MLSYIGDMVLGTYAMGYMKHMCDICERLKVHGLAPIWVGRVQMESDNAVVIPRS
jgi:hypothetical protein